MLPEFNNRQANSTLFYLVVVSAQLEGRAPDGAANVQSTCACGSRGIQTRALLHCAREERQRILRGTRKRHDRRRIGYDAALESIAMPIESEEGGSSVSYRSGTADTRVRRARTRRRWSRWLWCCALAGEPGRHAAWSFGLWNHSLDRLDLDTQSGHDGSGSVLIAAVEVR